MYKTDELSIKVGVSRQTLHNWINSGKIEKPRKQNNKLVWDKKHLDQIRMILKSNNDCQNGLEEALDQLEIGNRRYLGSKQKALSFILETVEKNTVGVDVVADVFSGTGVVADLFMRNNKKVIVNDLLKSNSVSYECWFGNEEINLSNLKDKIRELNSLEGHFGYVSENFGGKYFSDENAMKIDSIRENIEKCKSDFNYREYCFLLTSLIYAMDKVANTVGHFDAYRKKMDSFSKLDLRLPNIFKSKRNNDIFNVDANQLVRNLKADLVYIDTPYNSRGYENMYHVLENIVEWKKPMVEGVAMKAIDRSEKGSVYTKSAAPVAFDDLICNIDSRYILVSYNNTGKKGNTRSNAKISHEQIVSTLTKRGKVKIFDINFNPFTTGKTNLEEHKELLYLCEIDSKKLGLRYVNTPLNYSGSKYKLLSQILPIFPVDIKRFIEPFAGGAVTSINHALYNKNMNVEYLVNDKDHNIIDLYDVFKKLTYEEIVVSLEKMIKRYGFTDTFRFGYEKYKCNSSIGLAELNREPYNSLRSDFNNNPHKNPVMRSLQFYLLIIFGFNNQIRFNNNGMFNLPVGKRDFNGSMRSKLFEFHAALKSTEFILSTTTYEKFNNIVPGDFVYVDPPYSLGNASYNENGAWTKSEDEKLFEYLDLVDRLGGKFAMSNVALHKGSENSELISWASKYNLHVLNYNYNNSNYQSRAKLSSTVEVLITNY